MTSVVQTAPSAEPFLIVSHEMDLASILIPPFHPVEANAELLRRSPSHSSSSDTALLQLIALIDTFKAQGESSSSGKRVASGGKAEEDLVQTGCEICGRLSITVEAESRVEVDQDALEEDLSGHEEAAARHSYTVRRGEGEKDWGAEERLPLWIARDGLLGLGYNTSPETATPSPLSSLSTDSLSSLPDSPVHRPRRSTITPASSIASSLPFRHSKSSSLRTSTLSPSKPM
ncbi:hypothetical protein BCR35DRAFT_301039 [Leucosporidium creatinivorum]|uniref:Uncharacterized protein n=1 Tax=Leucosporidium creatinivorum TaxID=106004 RepID=A0A1Y2FXE2_9BASI|nr:hypothetical protein BCR35DRAFT_301039 [Leucosporidium creatinivorum]